MDDENNIVTDEMLLQAIRKRLMEDIQRKEQQAAIVNQIYGGAAGPARGVMGALGGAQQGEGVDPGMFDYFVDITREDLPELNPETGKPLGWKKSVHRYRKKKDQR